MTIPELLLILDHHDANTPGRYAGKLTRRDVEDLQDWIDSGFETERR